MQHVLALSTVEELQKHVHEVLCANDNLEVSQTPLLQSVILRRNKPCGLFFQVQGPRLLKAYAVWAGEENRILFYNCGGERIGETKLSEGPDPRRLAA